MGSIVMTLLVRRRPGRNAECPYAVQITFPAEMSPGEMTSLTSVRLIHKRGVSSMPSETLDSYHPEEWRAADLSEQAEYAAHFQGNPRPWYCVMRSLCKSVYDYPGSGDKITNNGQVWAGTEELEREWKEKRRIRRRCEEELDAEWNTLLAGETNAGSGGLERQASELQWAWRQIGPP